MPSKAAFKGLIAAGIPVDRCHYCRLDSLETEKDLSALFEVLDSVRDSNGGPCVVTANAVVANPDFEKIEDSGFSEYAYQRLDECYRNHEGCEGTLSAIKEGVESGWFCIQSHGREHVNVDRWLRYLRLKDDETRLAFQHGVYGVSTTISTVPRRSFLPAFDYDNAQQESTVNEIARDGLSMFTDLFGAHSESFIAPNYTWGKSLEKTLDESGVRYIQGLKIHRYCAAKGKKERRRLRYFGKESESGPIDLVRNAFFEPAENPNYGWIDHCLAGIQRAFQWRHPAVICTHRVNYMGSLVPQNRERNLKLLRSLLHDVKKHWPEVEFLTSVQLGKLIESHKHHVF